MHPRDWLDHLAQMHRTICAALYPEGSVPILVLSKLPQRLLGQYDPDGDLIYLDPWKHEAVSELVDTLVHEHTHACLSWSHPRHMHGPMFRGMHEQLIGMFL